MHETRSLRGVFAPSTTPMDADLSPAPGLLADHLRRLLDEGCHGVVLFGTTGEATSFSVAERRAALDAVLERGVEASALLVGVGCCALSDTIELALHAAAAGCAATLMLPPFYYKQLSDDALYRSFAMVFDRLGADALPTLLYHFPRLSQIPIPVEVVGRLRASHPGLVAGVKDSSGDPESLDRFLDAHGDLAIFAGTETLLLHGLRRGAAGTISASANVNAPALREVFDAFESGDPGVDALQEGITAFRTALSREPMVPALKRLLAERTGDPRWRNLRPPLA